MQEILVLGIGQTSIREHWQKSLRDLSSEAITSALSDSGLDHVEGIFIGNMMSGRLNKQEHLGAYVSDWIGQKGVEAIKVEAACGSGAAAFRHAVMSIRSGELNSALVLGVEKMTDSKMPETSEALATAADADYEVAAGLSFVAINALIMRRYMFEFNWNHSDFAPFSINSHKNAMNNPVARLKEIITYADYHKARMVSTPINLLDASPIGDGAAAIVLVPYKKINGKKIKVIASSSATDTLAVHSRRDPLFLNAAAISAHNAYTQAQVSPDDIDLFELHDAFSIMSVLSLEACGFAEKGEGPKLGLDDQISLNGKIPISTRGGLKARGHPVGATGVYQILEVVQQLRESAGNNQVDGARIGMAQNIGGSGATILTHILKVEQ